MRSLDCPLAEVHCEFMQILYLKTFITFVKISHPQVIFYKQVILNVLYMKYEYIKIPRVGVLQLNTLSCYTLVRIVRECKFIKSRCRDVGLFVNVYLLPQFGMRVLLQEFDDLKMESLKTDIRCAIRM